MKNMMFGDMNADLPLVELGELDEREEGENDKEDEKRLHQHEASLCEQGIV